MKRTSQLLVPRPSPPLPQGARDYRRRAGPLLLGPQLCFSPVKCLTHCLARVDGTKEFYSVKILTLADPAEGETLDHIQGKVLIHSEYSLLKRLDGQDGVIRQHGLFKDYAEQEVEVGCQSYVTGQMRPRIILVLDCYMPHDFGDKHNNLVSVQNYVIQNTRVPEVEALRIFKNVVQVVVELHKKNAVHRDLKLGNVMMDRTTREIKLTNFGLGKQLTSEHELLRDQRGSPAYVSPEVIIGDPYFGKPSDMWALGVMLYTMLYGTFPFYDMSPLELFRKIRTGEFSIPSGILVQPRTVDLIKSLIVVDATKRLTASQLLEKLEPILRDTEGFMIDSDPDLQQVVPEFIVGRVYDEDEPVSKRSRRPTTFPEMEISEVEMMLAELTNSMVSHETAKLQASLKDRTVPTLGGLPKEEEPGQMEQPAAERTESDEATLPFATRPMKSSDRAMVFARRYRNTNLTLVAERNIKWVDVPARSSIIKKKKRNRTFALLNQLRFSAALRKG